MKTLWTSLALLAVIGLAKGDCDLDESDDDASLPQLSLLQLSSKVQSNLSNIAALTELYMPAIHERAAREAFSGAYKAKSGNLKRLMASTVNLAPKVTTGTCKQMGCAASRGPTDCLLSKCICKYGYGTMDGETCVPIAQITLPPKAGQTTTDGTCNLLGCASSRGPTNCVSGKCVCKAGFYAPTKAKCVTIDDTEISAAMTVDMMAAGIVEPDEMPCPGSVVEMGIQGAQMVAGTRKYEVSLCRLSIQIYHGSPLPLVTRSQLQLAPNDNGDLAANNIGNTKDLYSLDTNRQWRTSLIQLMSKQFTYAVVTPNVVEAARRLGNIFHTFTDTWSASHVARVGPAVGTGLQTVADESVCTQFVVGTAISMDTVNWAVHSNADNQENLLYRCARYFTQKGIDLWAEIRSNPITDAAGANRAIDRFIGEVLCPALPVKLEDLDKPAGGATSATSSDFLTHKPVLPKGTSDMGDTERLIAEWDTALEMAKSSASAEDAPRFGKNIFISSRGTDACAWTPAAHVDDAFVQEAIHGSSAPNYLMPGPSLQLGEKLKRQPVVSASSLQLPSIHTDEKHSYA